jgi:hypothetical protein
VSMSKTGFAPTTLKEETTGGSESNDKDGEEFGEEMSYSTGGMMAPRGVNGSGGGGGGGRAPSRGRSDQDSFVVSEDQSNGGSERKKGPPSSDGGGGRKKGPPSSFGNSVSSAGDQSTGNPTRSIEKEIASGGMATPTGNMAKPKRKAPANPAAGGGNSVAPSGGAGRATGKKSLFVVSEDDAGTPDFGSSVAEASGSRTGWAPKAAKRATGSIDGGTTGGMTPKLNKPSNPQGNPQKKEFGSMIFDDCPPLESTNQRKPEGDRPLTRKQSIHTDSNQKHQRNPAVNLIDGGASKDPPRQVRFSGSMMAPRIRRKEQPAQPVTPPTEAEGDNPEDKEEAK